MIRNRPSGMMVHVASSSVEPSICTATGWRFLLYMMEKLTTSRITIVSPMRLTSTMKKYSASICGAIFDASGGNSAKFVIHLTRNCQNTWLMCSIPLSVHLFACVLLIVPVLQPVIAAEHQEHESAQRNHRYQAAQLHHAG